MYNRYQDRSKFVQNLDELQLRNGSEVPISRAEDYDIVVDLQDHTEDLEHLKPQIFFLIQNLCTLDNMAQKFHQLHNQDNYFPYDLAILFLDCPYVILEYWGTEENTQFDVVFEQQDDRFILKSFGTILDIPTNWEQETTKPIPQKTWWKKLFDLL